MSWYAIIAIIAVCAAAMVLDNRGRRKSLSTNQSPDKEGSNEDGNECLDPQPTLMQGEANEKESGNSQSPASDENMKGEGQAETVDETETYVKENGNEGKMANDEMGNKTQEMKRNDPMSRQVFIDTLVKIGCQYESDSDGRILFGYQGERFVASANNEHAYVSIWDYCWQSVELQDIDEVARLRKCINEANLNCGVKTVFTIDNEGGTIDVHCHSIILFIPQIPDIAGYLRLELNEFFRAHQVVGKEMEKLREKEKLTT